MHAGYSRRRGPAFHGDRQGVGRRRIQHRGRALHAAEQLKPQCVDLLRHLGTAKRAHQQGDAGQRRYADRTGNAQRLAHRTEQPSHLQRSGADGAARFAAERHHAMHPSRGRLAAGGDGDGGRRHRLVPRRRQRVGAGDGALACHHDGAELARRSCEPAARRRCPAGDAPRRAGHEIGRYRRVRAPDGCRYPCQPGQQSGRGGACFPCRPHAAAEGTRCQQSQHRGPDDAGGVAAVQSGTVCARGAAVRSGRAAGTELRRSGGDPPVAALSRPARAQPEPSGPRHDLSGSGRGRLHGPGPARRAGRPWHRIAAANCGDVRQPFRHAPRSGAVGRSGRAILAARHHRGATQPRHRLQGGRPAGRSRGVAHLGGRSFAGQQSVAADRDLPPLSHPGDARRYPGATGLGHDAAGAVLKLIHPGVARFPLVRDHRASAGARAIAHFGASGSPAGLSRRVPADARTSGRDRRRGAHAVSARLRRRGRTPAGTGPGAARRDVRRGATGAEQCHQPANLPVQRTPSGRRTRSRRRRGDP